MLSFRQPGFAEEAARSHQQYGRHHEEDDDLGKLRCEERGEAYDLADEEPGHDGPGQAAHAAHDHHDEALDDDLDPHLGVDAAHGTGEHAGQTGQSDAQAEDEEPDAIQVDAEGADHERVARPCTHNQADVRLLEEEPARDQDDGGDGDHEEAIDGEVHESEIYRARHLTGRVQAEVELAPEDLDAFHQDEREPEGEQEWVIGIPAVESPDEPTLDEETERADDEGDQDQRRPEALGQGQHG